MFSGLWHPVSEEAEGAPVAVLLYTLDDMVRQVWRVRHHLRHLGATQARAWELTLPIAPLSQGFHATRARNSGFPQVTRSQWTSQIARPDDVAARSDEHFEALARVLLYQTD
jgi:hypothetical protein